MPVPYPGGTRTRTLAYPAQIGDGLTFTSSLLYSQGANIQVSAKVDHAATLHILQYADAAGTILVQDTSQALTANNQFNVSPTAAKLFQSFEITIVNSSGAVCNVANLVVLQS